MRHGQRKVWGWTKSGNYLFRRIKRKCERKCRSCKARGRPPPARLLYGINPGSVECKKGKEGERTRKRERVDLFVKESLSRRHYSLSILPVVTTKNDQHTPKNSMPRHACSNFISGVTFSPCVIVMRRVGRTSCFHSIFTFARFSKYWSAGTQRQ